jgi:hypothetical protein
MSCLQQTTPAKGCCLVAALAPAPQTHFAVKVPHPPTPVPRARQRGSWARAGAAVGHDPGSSAETASTQLAICADARAVAAHVVAARSRSAGARVPPRCERLSSLHEPASVPSSSVPFVLLCQSRMRPPSPGAISSYPTGT